MRIIQLNRMSEIGNISKEGNQSRLKPILPPDFKHRQPLPDEELQNLRRGLRPEGTAPAIIELPHQGEDMIPLLRDRLQALGYNGTRVIRRVVTSDRLKKAIMTGTDRDSSSQLDYHGGDDGEKLAMIENGLNPLADGGVVTYVADLDLEGGKVWTRPVDSSFSVLIYAPDAIQYIRPSSNRTGSFSNGFAMFLDRRLIQPSLLAVLSPVPPQEIFRQSDR